jgi:uncharacterized BrkB/YihY/UPF0761 family membrane protein
MPEQTPEGSASQPTLLDLTSGRLSFSNSIGRSKLDPPLPHTASRRARFGRTTWRLIHGLYLHDSLEAASGMAFHFFLSLMPLLVVLGFLLGHLVKERGVDVLLDPLLEATPSMATQVVRHELERLAGQNGALAPLGMVGFVWLSSSGVHGLINAFERAARATKRPWWKKRLMSIGWSIATVATLCALAAALVTVDRFIHRIDPEDPEHDGVMDSTAPAPPPPSASPRAGEKAAHRTSRDLARENDATRDHEPDPMTTSHEKIRGGTSAMIHRHVLAVAHAPWERYCAMLALLVVSVGGLAIFYRYGITHPKGVRRRSWAGAVVAMTLFLLVSWGFGMYVATLGQYALYYGGLAAVAVLLFWLYLTSLALLVGAELNAQLEGIRD